MNNNKCPSTSKIFRAPSLVQSSDFSCSTHSSIGWTFLGSRSWLDDQFPLPFYLLYSSNQLPRWDQLLLATLFSLCVALIWKFDIIICSYLSRSLSLGYFFLPSSMYASAVVLTGRSFYFRIRSISERASANITSATLWFFCRAFISGFLACSWPQWLGHQILLYRLHLQIFFLRQTCASHIFFF